MFRAVSASVLGAMLTAVPAAAQEIAPPQISLELNALQQVSANCRMTFLTVNRLGVPIEELSVEVVLFDRDMRVSNFLVLNTGHLAVDKRRVRQFDLPDLTCAEVSSVLVNDVVGCDGVDLTPAVCLDALKPTSRAPIPLEF